MYMYMVMTLCLLLAHLCSSGGDSGPCNVQKVLMDAVKRGNLKKVRIELSLAKIVCAAHMLHKLLTIVYYQCCTLNLGKKSKICAN